MQKTVPPATGAPLTTGLRRFLFATATVTGAAIMIIEILGAKMLSPYFGTSHFVWTAQIAVTLVALACGYYAGGRLVDQSQRLARLYWAILAAAVWLCLTVLICQPVAFWCLDTASLAIGTLLASTILFFVPLALLAMTGPFLVRVLTANLSDVGGRVGTLTAVGTLGSFAGTLLIGYVLVPLMPNSRTMLSTAGVLIAVTAVYFIGWSRRSVAPAALLTGLAMLIGGMGLRREQLFHQSIRERFHGNSNFGELQVIELVFPSGTNRLYLNDYLTQNTYDPKSRRSTSMFTYLLHGLPRSYTSNIHDVLCIGVGVGIVPMLFAKEGARVDAVDINPAVIPLAEKFFDFDRQAVNLVIADGREFLNRTTNRYDAVALDAFLGDSCPSHLMTKEAFIAIRRVLRPGGVLVINTFANYSPGYDFFATSLERTLREVFGTVVVHSGRTGNHFYVACPEPGRVLVDVMSTDKVHPVVLNSVIEAMAGVHEPVTNRGLVLTDDYNPVEYYDAGNRDDNRRRLVQMIRALAATK